MSGQQDAHARWTMVVLWVVNDDEDATPNMVASWTQQEHENDGAELEAIARRRWYDFAGESYVGEWCFWTTVEHLNLPPAPQVVKTP